MQLRLKLPGIKAVPHPLGNRIDLQWLNLQPLQFTGVLVMRREGTHPTSPKDGELVADVENKILFNLDSSLKNSLDNKKVSREISADFLTHQIILSTNAVVSVLEPGSSWQIMDEDRIYLIIKNNDTLEVYGAASAVDQELRAQVVYYYTFFPYKSNPLEYIFDRRNRASAMATAPYDFAGQMYRILPTIYHRYDTHLPGEKYKDKVSEEDMKRGQLRRFMDLPGTQLDQLYSFAAGVLDFHNPDRVDGQLLPLLAQWIGWETNYKLEIETQRNELKNAPVLYKTIGIIPTLEAIVNRISGWTCRTKEFVHNIFRSNSPERLNLWLCHRSVSGQWQESANVFSLDFAYEGRPAAARDENGTLWLFYHTQRNNRWEIWYKTLQQEQEWTPSQPLGSTGPINKHPTAALQGNTLWVFWNSYHQEKEQPWEINFRKRINEKWYTSSDLDDKDILPGNGNQRKSPQAVVDHNNRLWLFWLEKADFRWQMKYNRHNGTKWELNLAVDFPLDGTDDPRVEKDLFALFHSKGSDHNIWVFWARKISHGNGGRGPWEIVYRQKSGVDSVVNGWGPIQTLPKFPREAVYHDCEPAAVVNADNEIELFWTSNQTRSSWATWNIKLESITAGHLNHANMLIKNPYSQRAPLPFLIHHRIYLVYYSNRSISYKSKDYPATATTDLRYAGSITIDTNNRTRLDLQDKYEDFQTYSYDTNEAGKRFKDKKYAYARDTIGIYLTPDTNDKQLIARSQELVKGILDRFLPIQTRVVFIIEPPLYRELVYTYDFSKEKEQHLINEQFFDNNITEIYPVMNDNYKDKAPGWIWIRSWSNESPGHHTVDFNAEAVDTKFRTWHIGIKK